LEGIDRRTRLELVADVGDEEIEIAVAAGQEVLRIGA
jgi:hypothetical protein